VLLVRTRIGPSTIHGTGLFAAEPIREGTRLWEFTHGFDVYLEPAEIDALPPTSRAQMQKYTYRDAKTGRCVLCADDARFFNHCDAPNTIDLAGAEGVTIAARDIAAGEELTCDYRAFDGDAADTFTETA
jgi:uncharacterized protein